MNEQPPPPGADQPGAHDPAPPTPSAASRSAPTPATSPRPPTRRRDAALAVLGTVLALVLLYAVAILVAPTENAGGGCAGIGFGCYPSPQTSLMLVGVIAGLPAVVLLLLTGGAGAAALLRWTRLPGVAAGVLGTLAGGVLVVIAALVLLIAL